MNSKKIVSKIIASSLILAIGAISSSEVLAYTKNETVYSKIDTEGNSYQTIVSEHLKNTDNLEVLNDISELLNIKNTNGDELPNQNGSALEWKAAGNDIYYQGNTDKELPIDCNIKYELDGEEMSSKDLAGKSGKVKITIEYTNKEARSVNINGKNETMYVPFVVMAGTLLDNTKIKNVEVTNGKVTDNGQKTLVVGLACPGLLESIAVDDEELDLNKIEITFDAIDFEMGNIMSYATPKIFEDADMSKLDKLDEIYSQINELKSASTQLVEGTKTLQEGTNTYVEKSTEFSNAMDTFTNGVNTATNSYSQIDDGITSVNSNVGALKNGSAQVNSGANQISLGLSTLKDGVEEGKEKATSALSQSSKALSDGIDKIIEGKDTEIEVIKSQVIEGGNEQLAKGLKNGISSSVAAAVSNGIDSTMSAKIQAILADETLTVEQKQALQAILPKLALTETEKTALESQISTQVETAIDGAVKQTSEAQKAGLDKIDNNEAGVKAGLNELKSQAGTSIKAGINQISSGFDDITNGTDQLISGTNTLKAGTSQLEEGTNKLQSGVNTLSKGSKQLKTGISTLNSSSNQLNDANKQLLEGAKTINDGATKLSDGMQKFDNEGISKLTSYINGDLKNIQTRVEKLQELANEYNNFAGLEDGIEGNTKFIFIIDSIKNNKEQATNIPVDNIENTSKNNDNNEETNSGK